MWGIDSPPRFEGWRPVEAAPLRQAANRPWPVRRRRCRAPAAARGRGKRRGERGQPAALLTLGWDGARRCAHDGQRAAGKVVCGGGAGSLEGGLGAASAVVGGNERRGGATYRSGEAVEEERGGGGGRRARRGAINGARPLAGVGGAIRGGDATSRAAV